MGTDVRPTSRGRLSPTVVRLGVVSLLTDVASDMIVPLLPIFLTGTLGAPMRFVGLVDGAAETLASFLKVIAGRWSDRARRRKPLVVFGYSIAAVARPVLALAMAPWHVLAVRLTDRLGKGVRTAPRDAWIAMSSTPSTRGRAFGFHRAMDNAGAFVGPLVGLALYRGLGLPLRWVFAAAALPGLAAVVVLIVGLKEPNGDVGPASTPAPAPTPTPSPTPAPAVVVEPMPPLLWRFLIVVFLFTLANSSDFFIILKAKDAGLDEAGILLAWTALSGLKSLFNTPGSMLSDRIGRRAVLLLGWSLFAAVYYAFSLARTPAPFVLVLVAYAGYYGLTEGAERALVADVAPAARRGVAFGLFHGAIGFAALPASYVFGAIADASTLDVAFRVSAVVALVAAVLLAILVRPPRGARL